MHTHSLKVHRTHQQHRFASALSLGTNDSLDGLVAATPPHYRTSANIATPPPVTQPALPSTQAPPACWPTDFPPCPAHPVPQTHVAPTRPLSSLAARPHNNYQPSPSNHRAPTPNSAVLPTLREQPRRGLRAKGLVAKLSGLRSPPALLHVGSQRCTLIMVRGVTKVSIQVWTHL